MKAVAKCPACGFENIEGADRCEECMKPMRDLDIPQAQGEGFQAHIMMDPVAGLYSKNPACVTSTDSVAHAVEVMQNVRIGCVPVVDGTALVGVLTEVDVLLALPTSGIDLADVRVSEVMTTEPETIQESTSIALALHGMSVGEYRHLPVVRDGAVIGILSIKDILRYQKQHLL
jgi:CBS domain-containing protein